MASATCEASTPEARSIPTTRHDSPFASRWKVVRELGRGSFSTVFLAEPLDRDALGFLAPPGPLAVKLFPAGDSAADLRAEIRAMTALSAWSHTRAAVPGRAGLAGHDPRKAAASLASAAGEDHPEAATRRGRRRRSCPSPPPESSTLAVPVDEVERLVEAGSSSILRAFGLEQSPFETALVLEPCLGGDLRDYLAARFSHTKRAAAGGLVTEAQARPIAFHLVLALAFCHSRGVAVRDLKPENVLIARDGSIRLSDFGLSATDCWSPTRGVFLQSGTATYMGPEGLAGCFGATRGAGVVVGPGSSGGGVEPDDASGAACGAEVPSVAHAPASTANEHGTAVDWWALGATLYELLLGVPPFFRKGQQDAETARRVLTEPFELPPWASSGQLSEEATSLLEDLLCKDPERRLGVRDAGVESLLRHPFFGRGRRARQRLAEAIPVDLEADGAWRWLPGLAEGGAQSDSD
ncbi:hypothetical protein FNF29_04450 [Cafeteria roenbergensis]|uniref:Protein kinase domain-containing protein n=1 Tax=Cafeteria roenbergensis TaxID=33653 RepID=A0A5A8CG07_CAFRO|nr:hypothetical protein FNF29_04450 [Cafeteria roenbergensis]|eukprot:KAA0151527.1 hypothetical protein FNF29_04450 [Cafeteria roenbergensis]